MEYAVLLIHLAAIIFLVRNMSWFKQSGVNPGFLSIMVILKTVAGIAAGLMYLSRYGGGDTYLFFTDGLYLKELFLTRHDDFWILMKGNYDLGFFNNHFAGLRGWINEDILYNDNRTISLIHMVISLFSGEFYSVHVAWFAFFSLAGLAGIYRFLSTISGHSSLALIFAVFCAPSVIAWLSVAGKDSIAVSITGIFCGILAILYKKNMTPFTVAFLLVSILAGFMIKPYIMLMLLPASAAWYLSVRFSNVKAITLYLLVYLLLFITVIGVSYLDASLDIQHMIYMKRHNFEVLAATYPESFNTLISLPDFEDNWLSMIVAAPAAFLSCMMEPSIAGNSGIMLAFGIENLFYILILGLALLYVVMNKPHKNLERTILFCMFFFIPLFILIGLTTPVAGALVRYKAPMLPFILALPAMILYGKGTLDRIRKGHTKSAGLH